MLFAMRESETEAAYGEVEVNCNANNCNSWLPTSWCGGADHGANAQGDGLGGDMTSCETCQNPY